LTEPAIRAHFIESGSRRIFVLMRQPRVPQGRAVLIAAPFAEEMNKSRRMLTLVGRELAARGLAVVLPDLTGTGDSDGEFRDADWESWRADLKAAAEWSAAEGWPIAALIGVRTGCLLGAQAARELSAPLTTSVFWQPVTDGERFLTQFLRLRIAATAMAGGNESMTQLRARLTAGEMLEVAGYELSRRLAGQLAGLRLVRELSGALGTLHWLELARGAAAALSETSQACIRAAQQAGLNVASRAVPGEPFWATTEIVEIPQLVTLTADALGAQS